MFSYKAGKEYEETVAGLFKTNNVLWRVILLQTFIILALVYGYLNLKETVTVSVELPSKIYQSKDLTIKRGLNWADKDFYDVWGLSLAMEMSEFKADDIGKKFALIQKMMRPSVALKKDTEIQEFVKNVVLNKITQKFTILDTPPATKIDDETFRLVFNGISEQHIGSKEMPRKECHYTVDLKIYEDGVLYVEDFGTNCMR